jgi:hypothetical protein
MNVKIEDAEFEKAIREIVRGQVRVILNDEYFRAIIREELAKVILPEKVRGEITQTINAYTASVIGSYNSPGQLVKQTVNNRVSEIVSEKVVLEMARNIITAYARKLLEA